MQSVSEIGKKESSNYVSAESLREMTLSKQDLFVNQKNELLTQFMSNMVRFATEQGLSKYAANLDPRFDLVLLDAITTELNSLGYVTTKQEIDSPTAGKFLQVVISWEKV